MTSRTTSSPAPVEPGNKDDSSRRAYNSPLRRQQTEQTRQKIVHAGAELVRSFDTWDWTNLTCKAVSERAGISERTVYRHFSTERHLRDAIMQELMQQTGINLEQIELQNFAAITTHVVENFATFAVPRTTVEDPTLLSIAEARREALLQAVQRATPNWTHRDQTMAAALLDQFWSPMPFESMTADWGMDLQQTITAITWVIKLINDAINSNNQPGASSGD
ncbi:TetR/AcrR family transcriptional regulator [Pseudomaricurvus sp. HS19]|uniref:TetR/AcrR family transcriptional regulator n=1 Tax=Pseudomaricurvus sp. HS19 TaxID=2692626 RepID=UPI00136F39DD|nr:TetR/AcrR family transcriptional regulator [Pseudomaricurvus sp. HS19]MYM64046.1 TetR family transcriptional regulator [Pseudomaricurvus sp. HS19]